ncbi:MAG: thioredoxin family protein [Flavipsychrobacter sp.]|nr:thioredoxin family protein [Flavipsychrobacter sp.]
MKAIFLSVLLLGSLAAGAQKKYDVSKDKEDGSVIYNGACTFGDLDAEQTFDWFKAGSAGYKPNTAAVTYLKKTLPAYELVVFMGTWCDDSHNLVPKLYKVLQQSGYPMTKYTMFGVDRQKTTKNSEHLKYKITLVPTIILLKDHQEVGRITENVDKSVEEDLQAIVKGAEKS